jgi:hypothetical protein
MERLVWHAVPLAMRVCLVAPFPCQIGFVAITLWKKWRNFRWQRPAQPARREILWHGHGRWRDCWRAYGSELFGFANRKGSFMGGAHAKISYQGKSKRPAHAKVVQTSLAAEGTDEVRADNRGCDVTTSTRLCRVCGINSLQHHGTLTLVPESLPWLEH